MGRMHHVVTTAESSQNEQVAKTIDSRVMASLRKVRAIDFQQYRTED